MKQPSTEWRERIAPDEAAHLVRVAKVIAGLQRVKSEKFGQGRALHRKQLLAATGTLEVFADLPDHARRGLFAVPGVHRALVRLSNGGPDIQANRVPDIRGFALKVFDVSGEAALERIPSR
jgi:catalase